MTVCLTQLLQKKSAAELWKNEIIEQ